MKAQMDQYEGLGIPDDNKDIKTGRAIPELDILVKQFERALDQKEKFSDRVVNFIWKEVLTQLTPEEIDRFLQYTLRYEDHFMHGLRAGEFVSKLVQNSYEAGHSRFTFDTQGIERISHIGYRLQATEENPITLTVHGNVGNKFCQHSEYIKGTVHGDAYVMFGENSRNGTFILHGNAQANAAYGSVSSHYEFKKNVDDNCGIRANDCTIAIEGSAGDFCGNDAEKTIIAVKGNVGKACGYTAHDSIIIINGTAGPVMGKEAVECLFSVGRVSTTDDLNLFPEDWLALTQNCTFVVYSQEDHDLIMEQSGIEKHKVILR